MKIECPIRDLLDKLFGKTSERICDDTTKYTHRCGCITVHTYDDTPGWRLNDWSTNCKNCILGPETCNLDFIYKWRD